MKSNGKINPRKINMKRIVILSLLLAQLSLRAQEVKQFSLQEALAFTEQNNLSYLNAQYDVQIAQETVKQTTSYGLPQVFDGTYVVGLRASKAFMGMSDLLKQKALRDAQLNVAKAYVTAVSTQKNLDLIQTNITLLEKSLYDITEMNKEGFVESLDVDRLTLSLRNLK